MRYNLMFVLIGIFFFARGQIVDSFKLPKNSIQLELLGNGIPYSINYERILLQKVNTILCGSIGSSFFIDQNGYNIGAIGEVDILFGKKQNYIEIGNGFTYYTFVGTTEGYTGFYVPRIGIRHISRNLKHLIRIGFTPLINIQLDPSLSLSPKFLPFGGIAYGRCF